MFGEFYFCPKGPTRATPPQVRCDQLYCLVNVQGSEGSETPNFLSGHQPLSCQNLPLLKTPYNVGSFGGGALQVRHLNPPLQRFNPNYGQHVLILKIVK